MLLFLVRILYVFVLNLLDVGVSSISTTEIYSWLPVIVLGYVGSDIASRYLKLNILGGAFSDDVLAKDTRPPVIYLRSFNNEQKRAKFVYDKLVSMYSEGAWVYNPTMLAISMNLLGPFFAIGRPSENFNDMSGGIARKYVSDDEWQKVVSEFLQNSSAVVMEVGYTNGLKWEMLQLVSHIDPKKVLFVLPESQIEYEMFTEWASKIFPRNFPEEIGSSRLMMFKDRWYPVLLPFKSEKEFILEPSAAQSMLPTLLPFVEQNEHWQESLS